MLNFSEIKLEDKQKIDSVLRNSGYQSSSYNFTTQFIWQKYNKTRVAFYDNSIPLIFFKSELNDDGIDEKIDYYLMPSGLKPNDKSLFKIGLNEIIETAKMSNKPFVIKEIFQENLSLFNEITKDSFQIIPDRNMEDYIYKSEALINLKGKKFHSKRNHIKNFKKQFDYQYSPINSQNIENVYKMNKKWCESNGCRESISLTGEKCAVKKALEFFNQLSLIGGVLTVEDEIIAYSFGEKLNENTFLIHIEKVLPEFNNAYPVINQEFAKDNCQNIEFINREEDMGKEGLRKAKLSYHPEYLIKKYKAIYKN